MNLEQIAKRAQSIGVHIASQLDDSITLAETITNTGLEYKGSALQILNGRMLYVQRRDGFWVMRAMDDSQVKPPFEKVSSTQQVILQLEALFPERLA